MPKPRKNEKRKDYVERFCDDSRMKRKYRKRDQRCAIAYKEWRQHKNKKK